MFYVCSVFKAFFGSRRLLIRVAAVFWLVAARVLADDGYAALGWTSQTGTAGDDEGYGVAVSGDGFIYVTGYTEGSLNDQVYAGIYI